MRLGVQAALVDGALVAGDVDVDGGAIVAVGLAGAGRGIAAPGFVDLQVNGFAGVDFMHTDRDGYARAGEAMLATGTTAYQPTFITASEADLRRGAGARSRTGAAAGRASSARTSRGRSSRRAGSACTRRRGSARPTRRCSGGCSTRAACTR